MSTAQTFLAIGAIFLFSITSLNVNRISVKAVHNSIENQVTSDAVNFGRDMSDMVQSYAFQYDNLVATFGGLNDVTSPSHRMTKTTSMGHILHAVFDVSSEHQLRHGQTGRIVTIRVFLEDENDFVEKAEYVTSVVSL